MHTFSHGALLENTSTYTTGSPPELVQEAEQYSDKEEIYLNTSSDMLKGHSNL